MKTIGLLGGMSWESTAVYYRVINEAARTALGGLHSARVILYSVEFAQIEKMQRRDDWGGAARVLSEAASSLQLAGADFLVLCSNTMHKVAPQIQSAVDIPMLHIADAAADVLRRDGFETVGLLGTSFTMEQDFYKGYLAETHGVHVVIPELQDRQIVHRVIFEELCVGETRDSSKQEYLRIIGALTEQGAQAILLGCTEVAMLVGQDDTGVKLLDTASIHARKAVQLALT